MDNNNIFKWKILWTATGTTIPSEHSEREREREVQQYIG